MGEPSSSGHSPINSELQSVPGVTFNLYACVEPALSLAGTGGMRDPIALKSLLGLASVDGSASQTTGSANVTMLGLALATGRRAEFLAEAVPQTRGKPKVQITGIAMLPSSRDRPFVWMTLSSVSQGQSGPKCDPTAQ